MKLATLELTPELFIEFCKASRSNKGMARRFVVKENPLPDDVEVVSVLRTNHPADRVRLVLKSETFVDVPDGADPPEVPQIFYEAIYEVPVETGDA